MNQIVGFAIVLSVLCQVHVASYAQAPKTPAAAAPAKQAAGLAFVKKTFSLKNPPPGFSVKFDYPFFVETTPAVAKLNAAMQDELLKQAKTAAKDYSDFVSDDLPISKEAKKKKDGSSITASFEVHKTTDNIVSVSFATCSYYYGAAHPVNNYFVFNTQLSPLTPILLANMTTDEKKFLLIVSKQCAQQIKKILKYPNPDIIAEGTAPEAANFQNFVFLDKAIGFYFNDAQASIHAEPIERPVGVPYGLFKGLIRQGSPIGALVK